MNYQYLYEPGLIGVLKRKRGEYCLMTYINQRLSETKTGGINAACFQKF